MGKKKTFNIDFLAQNINIKLVGFWVSLRFSFLFFPHLSSHHKDVTFFIVWKTFSLFSCLYEDNFDHISTTSLRVDL